VLKMKRFATALLTLLLATGMGACGFNDPSYTAYETPADEKAAEGSKTETAGEGAGDAKTCPDSAVAVFAETVQPAVDTACSNCHNGQHKLPLPSGSAAENRAALLAWSGGDGSKLAGFISSKPPHEGGDQSAALPASKIQFWVDAEAACAK